MPSLISVLEPVGLGDMMGDGGSGVERCGRSGEAARIEARRMGGGRVALGVAGPSASSTTSPTSAAARWSVSSAASSGWTPTSPMFPGAGYQDYYSRRTREIVAERFARDIEAFGYRF
jgi:hypothetical protein